MEGLWRERLKLQYVRVRRASEGVAHLSRRACGFKRAVRCPALGDQSGVCGTALDVERKADGGGVCMIRIRQRANAAGDFMSADRKLFLALETIDRETASLPLEDALGLIDAKLRDPELAEFRPHFDVHKAVILCSKGENQRAVDLLRETAEHFPHAENVHYFAGQCLLELGQFEAAIFYLDRCIELIGQSGDTWYQSSAFALRAYCAAKTGRLDLARRDLEYLDDDEPMSWIDVDPVVSKTSIMRMITLSGSERQHERGSE